MTKNLWTNSQKVSLTAVNDKKSVIDWMYTIYGTNDKKARLSRWTYMTHHITSHWAHMTQRTHTSHWTHMTQKHV